MDDLWIEDLNYYGATTLGPVLTQEQVDFFREDIMRRKQEDIDTVGKEKLIEINDYEIVRDLARFGGRYFEIIENETINRLIDTALNDKAVIHSFNGIILFPTEHSDMVGHKIHRDQPYFKDTRTSILMMIPLVDYDPENGATEYVPGTHLFEGMPSEAFLNKHKMAVSGKAGEAYAVDAVVWHKAGINCSTEPRPMIVLRYTLAPFKQQVDMCKSCEPVMGDASDLVKQRLGWNVRTCDTYEEFRVPDDQRKFKSGQYDMSNTYIR